MEELLLLACRDLLQRLQGFSDGELRDLYDVSETLLQPAGSEIPGGSEGEAASSDSEDSEDGDALLALEDAGSAEDDAGGDATQGAATRESRESRPQAPIMIGISRKTWKQNAYVGYSARVHFLNLSVCAQAVKSLDTAIDMHISLVRLRQLVRAKIEEGVPCKQALLQVVELIREEPGSLLTIIFHVYEY